MCQHCDTYKYLEPRPKNWRNQLWIKGRNMTVWHLIATMRTERETLEQTAKKLWLAARSGPGSGALLYTPQRHCRSRRGGGKAYPRRGIR